MSVLLDETQLAKGAWQWDGRWARPWGEVQAGRTARAELLKEDGGEPRQQSWECRRGT